MKRSTTMRINAKQLVSLIRESMDASMNGPDILLQHALDEIESLRVKLMRLKASKVGSDPDVAEVLRDCITSVIVAMDHVSGATDAMKA